MGADDFVETSDVEKLQELEDEDRRALSSSCQIHSSFSPRKRVKVGLVVRVSFVQTYISAYISSKLYHGSVNDETVRPHSRSQLSSATLPVCFSTSQTSDAPTNSPPSHPLAR